MRIIATFKYFCILCHWSLLGYFLVAMSWYILGPFWIPNILSDVDKTSLEMRDFGKNRFCRSGSNVCNAMQPTGRHRRLNIYTPKYLVAKIYFDCTAFFTPKHFCTRKFGRNIIFTSEYLYNQIFVQQRILLWMSNLQTHIVFILKQAIWDEN